MCGPGTQEVETGTSGSAKPEQSFARFQMLSLRAVKQYGRNMAANAMETDDLGHLPSSTLRRSNSAPNVSAAVVSDAIPIFQPLQTARQRRFSTSQMAVNVVSKNSANKCQARNPSFWLYFAVLISNSSFSAVIIFQGSPASRIEQIKRV